MSVYRTFLQYDKLGFGWIIFLEFFPAREKLFQMLASIVSHIICSGITYFYQLEQIILTPRNIAPFAKTSHFSSKLR